MTNTKQTKQKQLNTKDLFGKINYLNRKISKYRKNTEVIKNNNIELRAKLSKIPSFVKFIFGIKNN